MVLSALANSLSARIERALTRDKIPVTPPIILLTNGMVDCPAIVSGFTENHLGMFERSYGRGSHRVFQALDLLATCDRSVNAIVPR